MMYMQICFTFGNAHPSWLPSSWNSGYSRAPEKVNIILQMVFTACHLTDANKK